MKSVVLRPIGHVILAFFTLLFIACPKPVSLKTFLEDEKVKEIIEKNNTGVTPDLGYGHPSEKGPKLEYGKNGAAAAPLPNNGEVTISITQSDTLVITVSNASDYDPGSIEWSYDGGTPLAGSTGTYNETMTITAGDAAFTEEKPYSITVTGTIHSAPYSTAFFIKVEP
jgi:hypothetical protein